MCDKLDRMLLCLIFICLYDVYFCKYVPCSVQVVFLLYAVMYVCDLDKVSLSRCIF